MPHLDVYIDIEWSENVNTHPNCVCAYLTNIGSTMFWQCPLLSYLPHPWVWSVTPYITGKLQHYHYLSPHLAQYLLTNTSGMSNSIVLFWGPLLFYFYRKPLNDHDDNESWCLHPAHPPHPEGKVLGELGLSSEGGARTCAPPPSPTSATSTPPSWRPCLGQTPGSRTSSADLRHEYYVSLLESFLHQIGAPRHRFILCLVYQMTMSRAVGLDVEV